MSADFVVPQHRQAPLPGSNGWLRVHIADITDGSTVLRITSADGAVVVASTTLTDRDAVEFALANERCQLVE